MLRIEQIVYVEGVLAKIPVPLSSLFLELKEKFIYETYIFF